MTNNIVHDPHIQDLRKDMELYQADAAIFLHRSRAASAYREIGRRDLPSDVLNRVASQYRCSVDDLNGNSNYLFSRVEN